jgi:hypothetical protein
MMVVEKRRYVRFLPQPNTYAALGSCFTIVGKVKDISIGGLAFEYINNTDDSERHYSKIAIFLSENGFYLENISCRVISDIPTISVNKKTVISSNCITNRCAVQFTAVTEDQKERIEHFLKHYTHGLDEA